MSTSSESPFSSTLPGRYYFDPAIYAEEQEKIFSRMWTCFGRAEALSRAGSYVTVNLGNENVIVVRGSDGNLRAFLNVCRHRGARLCTAAAGHLKGSIQCRYHAWTYALDGCLIGAPNVLTDDYFDRTSYGLMPVALQVWEGYIWLSLADAPAPVEQQVRGAIVERFGCYETFARYQLAELKVGKTIEYDVQANWKLVLENFMECYHCSPMHPEFCQLLPEFRTGAVYANGEAAMYAEGIEAFTVTGKASRPPLPGLLPEDLRRYYGIVIMPNVLLNLLDDHVVVHTLFPAGPARTRVVCDWLFDLSAMARPDFDPLDAVEIFDIVNRQDWEVCELTQQGMSSRAYARGGLYVPAEHDIYELNKYILARLDHSIR